MKKNRHTGFIAVLILFSLSLQAQSVGAWKSYMAYNNATVVTKTPNAVYAVYDGSLFSYSPEDQLIQTYSIQDDLSPSTIQFLNYCPNTKSLLIVYEDSNIDIFLGRNNVYHLPDIKNDIYLSNKVVNSVEIRDGLAYLSTGFGVVVIDMRRREFKNDYKLGVNTMATCEWGDFFYAATDDGLLRVPLSSNLLDKTNWSKVNGLGDVRIAKMVLFNDYLVFYDEKRDGGGIWYLSREGVLECLDKGIACKQLTVLNNQLVMIVWHMVLLFDDFDKKIGLSLNEDIKHICSGSSKNSYWIAWGDRGIVEIEAKGHPGEWIINPPILTSHLKVNSPIRNHAFRLKFSGEKLLVTGGDRGDDRRHLPGTFMIYENDVWKNLDTLGIKDKTGVFCKDLMDAVEDPRNPGRYYVSSWGEGIYVFNKNLELETLYSVDNSTLQSILPGDQYYLNYIRVDGMTFDNKGNLYAVSALVNNGLNILSNTGEWSAHAYGIFNDVAPNQIFIARDGKKWVNFFRRGGGSANIGIFVLDDTKGVVDPTNDIYYSSKFTDQQGRNIGAATYSCITEDLSGTIWVGTDNGLITFSSAEQVGRGDQKDRGVCYRLTGVDQYGDGHYLLDGQKVTAIAVDGGNRKWIGTTGGGVFLVDHSGGLNVQNFNTSNSQILSDNVTSIAINGKTGEVFIGTDRGICSYQGDAIDGKPDYSEVYAFPNPVFPHRNSRVVITGLMQNSRVKITDLAGNLMRESVSNGGQYTWNCTNPRGEIVSPGIYLVFATLPDGSQGVVTKIMVIK